MELFKTLLFGLTGASLIFWVCIIAFWHTYIFRDLFREDFSNPSTYDKYNNLSFSYQNKSGLANRGKYSMKSFVIADFTPIANEYGVNRLYTSILISLGAMSFIVLTYGLQSGFKLYGLA